MKEVAAGKITDIRHTIAKVKVLCAFAAIYLIWGSTYLAIRYAVETIPPFFMIGTRSVIAGCLLVFWSFLRDDERIRIEHIPSLALTGGLFFLMGHGALAWAEERIPSGIAALIVASLPFWMVCMEKITQWNMRIGYKTVAGMILGILALFLLISPRVSVTDQELDLLRAGALLIGVIAWAVASVYSRSATLPKAPLATAGGSLVSGGILLLIFGFIAGEPACLVIADISVRSFLSLGYLIVFGSVIAFTAYIWLLSKTSAARVSTYAFVNPVIAVAIGWSVGGEKFTPNIVLVTFLIVLAIYFILSDKLHTSYSQSNS
jgi:drug/metabolite transporter (DMT)-like permease